MLIAMRRKSFIKSLVKEVRVTGKQVVLNYVLYLKRVCSREEVSVPPIVDGGGPFWARTRDLDFIRIAL